MFFCDKIIIINKKGKIIHMHTEKSKEYFITRYSLIPDTQIDFDTFNGVTKEEKFVNWLVTFSQEKNKETDYRGSNYILYCKKISNISFFISFAKEFHDVIGQKTDSGIIDTPIENYKKCNIIINTKHQWMIIEKSTSISSPIENQKNIIANVISKFLKPKDLYFEIGIMAEKNYFWEYVSANKDSITDIEITLSSPNFLEGIKTVDSFLHRTNEAYNNTSIGIHLKNEEGHLNIDTNNEFLQDAIRYSSSGGGKWKVKSSTDKTGCSNVDNPFIIRLPEEISQLKDSDLKSINNAFEHIKRIDPEHRRE